MLESLTYIERQLSTIAMTVRGTEWLDQLTADG